MDEICHNKGLLMFHHRLLIVYNFTCWLVLSSLLHSCKLFILQIAIIFKEVHARYAFHFQQNSKMVQFCTQSSWILLFSSLKDDVVSVGSQALLLLSLGIQNLREYCGLKCKTEVLFFIADCNVDGQKSIVLYWAYYLLFRSCTLNFRDSNYQLYLLGNVLYSHQRAH